MEVSVSEAVIRAGRFEEDEDTVFDPDFVPPDGVALTSDTAVDSASVLAARRVRQRASFSREREETPLETAMIGPAVNGLRGAFKAIAFYASFPESQPRPGRLDRTLFGVANVLAAMKCIARDPELRDAALMPALVSFIGCTTVGLGSAFVWHSEGGDPVAAFLTAFVATASLPPIILRRLWIRLALASRKSLHLPEGKRDEYGAIAGAFVELQKMTRQSILVAIGLAPIGIALKLFPGGELIVAGCVAIWALYWLVINAFDLVFDVMPGLTEPKRAPWFARIFERLHLRFFGRLLTRIAKPWRHEVAYSEWRATETVGLGMAVGFILAIPVLGILFRPIAVVAATQLTSRFPPQR